MVFKTNDTPTYNSIVHSYDLILYILICPLKPVPFFLIRQYILKKSKKSAYTSLFSLIKYQINVIQSRCLTLAKVIQIKNP